MKIVAAVSIALVLGSSALLAQGRPDYQNHIDWAASDWTPADQTNCPDAYFALNIAQCLLGGGRGCVIAFARVAAANGDYNRALQLVLLTQCHNGGAQQAIQGAGAYLVSRYLILGF